MIKQRGWLNFRAKVLAQRFNQFDGGNRIETSTHEWCVVWDNCSEKSLDSFRDNLGHVHLCPWLHGNLRQ